MRQATSKDIPEIIRILAPAFGDNKSVNRCIKQGHRRLRRIENQIRYASIISIRNNMAYLNASKTGAVLCKLSHGKKASMWDDLYYILRVSGLKLGLQLMKREKLLAQNHPGIPHINLWYIGVDNSNQGKGVGTEMIEYVKQVCRERSLPVYLETSNPRNFRFYEQNGFTMYQKMKLPMDDFELYFYSWAPDPEN